MNQAKFEYFDCSVIQSTSEGKKLPIMELENGDIGVGMVATCDQIKERVDGERLCGRDSCRNALEAASVLIVAINCLILFHTVGHLVFSNTM